MSQEVEYVVTTDAATGATLKVEQLGEAGELTEIPLGSQPAWHHRAPAGVPESCCVGPASAAPSGVPESCCVGPAPAAPSGVPESCCVGPAPARAAGAAPCYPWRVPVGALPAAPAGIPWPSYGGAGSVSRPGASAWYSAPVWGLTISCFVGAVRRPWHPPASVPVAWSVPPAVAGPAPAGGEVAAETPAE